MEEIHPRPQLMKVYLSNSWEQKNAVKYEASQSLSCWESNTKTNPEKFPPPLSLSLSSWGNKINIHSKTSSLISSQFLFLLWPSPHHFTYSLPFLMTMSMMKNRILPFTKQQHFNALERTFCLDYFDVITTAPTKLNF